MYQTAAGAFGSVGPFSSERSHHAWIGSHFLSSSSPVLIVLIPLRVEFCACPHQRSDHIVIISAPGSLRGAPTIQSPPQGSSPKTFVFRINRRAAFQQQLDGVHVSTECSPM